MRIRHNSRKHDETAPAPTVGGGTDRKPHPEGRQHRSFFDGLDSAARTFFGPAARSDGSTPVVHRHDAAEEESESALRSIEIHTDSLGHHYAVQKRQPDRPAADTREQPDGAGTP